MLSKTIEQRLNDQINLEAYSCNLYLAMSAWCFHKGYEGSAAFLKQHAMEEQHHMLKLFDYVNEVGSLAEIRGVEAPAFSPEGIDRLFGKIYEHEKFITQSINALVDQCLKEKDYSTFNFLQWYVSEQHEEERLFLSILDKIEIIGLDGRGLFMLDQEVGRLTAQRG